MTTRLRIILILLMGSALGFGFLHLFTPAGYEINFERLHIFLFNLCSGGTILIYYTEKRHHLSNKGRAFLTMALCYAILAFFEFYIPAIILSLSLALLVENIRTRRFHFIPVDILDPHVAVAAKFHHAALLCLSLALIASSLVIVNNEYLHLVRMAKLKLDTFFLGFSFPLSLITMSVMFSLMKKAKTRMVKLCKIFGFWSVNLGVMIFFLFILFEKLLPQVVVTAILFITVIMIFHLYETNGIRTQQKNFLTSGMFFLLFTAITGILYIIFEIYPFLQYNQMHFLLKIHAFASLYGWNLCGLVVICRQNDFPLTMNSNLIIAMHWVTVVILAPLGYYSRLFAVAATVAYIIILTLMLFSRGSSIAEELPPAAKMRFDA